MRNVRREKQPDKGYNGGRARPARQEPRSGGDARGPFALHGISLDSVVAGAFPAKPGDALNQGCAKGAQGAFTLVETVIAMLLLGIVCAGLYAGISMSFQNVQLSREDLRAAQITTQTMEIIRLCTWSQSDPSTNFLPSSFTAPYENTGSTSLVFQVSVTVTNAPGVTEVYSNDLRVVTVQTSWTNNNILRTRAMSTYVAKEGLLWYVPY